MKELGKKAVGLSPGGEACPGQTAHTEQTLTDVAVCFKPEVSWTYASPGMRKQQQQYSKQRLCMNCWVLYQLGTDSPDERNLVWSASLPNTTAQEKCRTKKPDKVKIGDLCSFGIGKNHIS